MTSPATKTAATATIKPSGTLAADDLPMIAFSVDRDWYRKHWYGESVAPGDEDHCAISMRWISLTAARVRRGAAAGFGVVLGIAVRRRIGECP